MTKIEKLILVCLLQVVFYTAHAQANFKEATIIQLNGDTIKGEINYPEWVYNPKTIEFRHKNDKKSTIYSYKNIKGFTINYKNEQYQSAIVDLDNTSLDISNLQEYESLKEVELAPKLVRDTAFLLVEAKGQLNLFSLQYRDGKIHFFTQKNNGSIEELRFRRAKIKTHDSTSIITIRSYKKQLQYLTSDCTSQKQDFSKLPYFKSEILKAVTNYNVCSGQPFYIHKEKSGQRHLLIFTGAAIPFIKMSDEFNEFFQGNTSPLFGIGFEQSYNKLRSRLGVGIDVSIANCKADISKEYYLYSNVAHFKLNTISTKVHPYLRYFFTSGIFQPYIKAGVGFLFYNNKKIERFYTDLSSQPYMRTPLTLSKKRFETVGSVGIKVKNFFIESRYNSGIGHTLNGEDNVIIKQLSFSCGYSWVFNKNDDKK